MADPFPNNEPCLSAFMRVQRGTETAQDLITAFPALEQGALNSSAAIGDAGTGLTEQDRRRLLDFPDAEGEAANIRRVSSRTREELLSTATSRPADLSDAELELLTENFWANVTPQEMNKKFVARLASRTHQTRIDQARNAAMDLDPSVWSAFSRAGAELHKRKRQREYEQRVAKLASSLGPAVPAWMTDLARQIHEEYDYQGINTWGFIALYDAEVQETTSIEDLDRFEATVEGVLRSARASNGAEATGIAWKWRLHFANAPQVASTADTTTTAMTTTRASSSASSGEQVEDYGSTMRDAFRAYLDSPEWLNILQWDHGVRTDIFLVINQQCIELVLGDAPYTSTFLDDMRIAAYEADFTPADRASCTDGYEGWTWVRLEQLVFRFYGAACTRPDITMHDIWKAAQVSRHNAFVSLDPEVAQGWSMSVDITGQVRGRYDVHF